MLRRKVGRCPSVGGGLRESLSPDSGCLTYWNKAARLRISKLSSVRKSASISNALQRRQNFYDRNGAGDRATCVRIEETF